MATSSHEENAFRFRRAKELVGCSPPANAVKKRNAVDLSEML